MRHAQIQLARAGRDSRAFAQLLHGAQIFTLDADQNPIVAPDLERVVVSFAGFQPADSLELVDLATLAAIIRTVAETRRTVEIRLPRRFRGRPSRMQQFIERTGFSALFSRSVSDEWPKYVVFDREPSKVSDYQYDDLTTNYIHFRWVGKADFVYAGTNDLYSARPTIHPHIDHHFRSVLRAQGFLNDDTIDLLSNTMFLELGWNVILHSSSIAGEGIGVFGAQIARDVPPNPQPVHITFCIADAGRGIPRTLRDAYDAEQDPRFKLRTTDDSVGLNTDIVRYALFAHTSSRKVYPSEVDRTGFRGLAQVSAALLGIGDMILRSDGGAVKLRGAPNEVKTDPDGSYDSAPIVGTQVVGRLRRTPKPTAESTTDSTPQIFPKPEVVLVSDLDGGARVLLRHEDVASFVSNLHPVNHVVLFDLGYFGMSARHIEYLCKAAISRFHDKWCIFWSSVVPWTELVGLDEWLKPQAIIGGLPPLFVRGLNDSRLLGPTDLTQARQENRFHIALPWLEEATKSPRASPPSVLPGIPVYLTPEIYISLASRVNSHYLEQGFAAQIFGNPESIKRGSCGFFCGSIHLLRGGPPVSRYFALSSNLAGSEANLRRWSESCTAAVLLLLSRTSIPADKLVFLGFTGTMRNVVAQTHRNLGESCRGFMLLTFDVPSREEISSKIREGDQVVLLTDVVSTGSLVEAVAGLIKRVNATVAGVVSLIDIRQTTTHFESPLTFGRDQLPTITTGRFGSVVRKQAELADQMYWVDPVSLIPSIQKPPSWDDSIDEKIESTLRIVCDAGALRCGHIIDGTRHASLYVDLQEIIDKRNEALRQLVSRVTSERLHKREWADFRPSIVLHPAGISRIEPIAKAEATSGREFAEVAYRTAARSFANDLTSLWPSLLAVEVLRAFDPGGDSRCANTIELPTTVKLPPNDVVVADDGMWTGGTVDALVRIALSIGARRVLVIPLLARIPPYDVERLEATQTLRINADSPSIDVCYAFPLLLPVPYYTMHECPYEVTMHRLQDRRSQLPSVATFAEVLIKSLEARTPSDAPEVSPAFAATWMRLRTYVELAALRQDYLDKISHVIENAQGDENLLAMFRLFTEEWRLLGRSRLRQTLRPILRAKAVQAVTDRATTGETRIAAVTLLRSLFCETFVDILPELALHISDSAESIERVVLQIATLTTKLKRASECRRFLEHISEGAPSMLLKNTAVWSSDTLERYFAVVTICRALSVELALEPIALTSKRAAAAELFHQLQDAPGLRHSTRPFLEIIAGSTKSIHELGRKQFHIMHSQWISEHQVRISESILKPLRTIHSLLQHVATLGRAILTEDCAFLRDDCAGVRREIAALSSGLAFLAESDLLFFHRIVLSSSDGLLSNLLSRSSSTMQLLQQMRTVTVREMVSDFTDATTSRFEAAGRKVSISVRGLEALTARFRLFCPPEVVRDCFNNILDNLFRYAYVERPLAIEIALEETIDEAQEPTVRVIAKNDGANLRPNALLGVGGSRAAADLEQYGGSYFFPTALEEQPWTVAQRVDILLW